MNDRPGFMVYFDTWLPVLRLDDATIAELFRAAVMYAKNGEIPAFSGVDEIFWDMIRPVLDRDALRYSDTVKQRQYAGYCSAARRAGIESLPFEEWEKQRMLTSVDGCQPTTIPTIIPEQNHIQLERQTEKETQGDAGEREGRTFSALV